MIDVISPDEQADVPAAVQGRERKPGAAVRSVCATRQQQPVGKGLWPMAWNSPSLVWDLGFVLIGGVGLILVGVVLSARARR